MVDSRSCLICHISTNQGITIIDSFLCQDCEQEIIKTEVEDSRYMMFVSKLKEMNLERYMI